MGIRKDITGGGLVVDAKEEGIMMGRVRAGEESWRAVGVYVGRRGTEETLRELEECMEREGGREKTIIRENFNARTGREGRGIGEDLEEKRWEGVEKRSRDGKINREDRMMVNCLEQRKWMIFTGAIRGDKEGEFTFTRGKRDTVIDYVVGNGEVRDKVAYMRIGDRVTLKGRGHRGRGGKNERRMWRGVWDREGQKMCRERLGRVEMEEKDLEMQ